MAKIRDCEDMDNNISDNIYFLDFEASSLSWNSFPIEIAWGNQTKRIKSFLINPNSISSWNDWSYDSQLVHGISYEELIVDGAQPSEVCNEIRSDLSCKIALSDNPDWDCFWMSKLFESCEIEKPAIDFQHIDSFLIKMVCPNMEKRIDGLKKILELKWRARTIIKGQHRAHIDVKYMIELWNLSKEMRT